MQSPLCSGEEESIRCRSRRDDGFVGSALLLALLLAGIGFWVFGGDGCVWMEENLLPFWIFFGCVEREEMGQGGLELEGFGGVYVPVLF